MQRRGQMQKPREAGSEPVDDGEKSWMYGRSQMIFPFLSSHRQRRPSSTSRRACYVPM